jgi:hypothetical protein
MEKINIPLSYMRQQVLTARECFDMSYSAGHFTSLIKTIGLKNVLRFPDIVTKDYLIQHGVPLTIAESIDFEVIVEEDR